MNNEKAIIWGGIVVLVIVIIGLLFWYNATPVTQDTTPVTTTDPYSTSTPTGTVSTATPTPSSTSLSDNQANNKHMITIETNKGTIVFETYDADAPKTVANFVTLAQKGFYDGVIFHRVIPGFMIQGGDPTGTGRGGPGYTFADELNPSTASYKKGYVKGTVAMANAGPNTNGSQFFIMQADQALPNSYSIFGHVTSGLDVVDAIAAVPRDGADKPLSPVTIKKVTVSDVK